MRILLIRPDSFTQTLAPPMGLLYIGAAVRQFLDAKISFIDGRLERIRGEALARKMAEHNPDIVGITAIMNEIDGAVETAKIARQLWQNAKLVIGGPWPSSAPQEALQLTGADILVRGEGESAFTEIVRRVEEGLPLTDISGTCVLENGELRETPREYREDLDSLPYPAYDAINLERYLINWRNGQNRLQRSTRIMPLFTSRGCPFNCIFCHNLYGKKFRPRSAEHVLGEIELLVKRYGVEEIEVSDDIFNFDLRRAKRIAQEIIRRKLGIRLSFPNGLRADRTDEELIDLLAEAGCTRICYAVESASPRIQKIIGKGINLEKTAKMIEYTAKKGINVGGFFIFGFPGETLEDMKETVRFAVESALDTASFFYLAPFPGTRLVKEYPEASKARFRDFTDIPINLSAVSDQELSDMRKNAYRKFYFNKRRILRNIKTSPKNILLFKNFWAIVKLVTQDYVAY